MNNTRIGFLGLVAIAALAAGCSSAVEYEVTGEVTSASAIADPISLEFFELDPADTAAERESVHTAELAALGEFTQTVEASEGYNVIALALVDSDKDGKCTEGELWAEATMTPTAEGTLEAITLDLKATACPVVDAAAE